MELQEWARIGLEVGAVAFAAGVMRQELRSLNKTVERIEHDFTTGMRDLREDLSESVRDLTGRVNDHGERLGKLEGERRWGGS